MNILTIFIIILLIIFYKDIKNNIEEIIIDILKILLLPIKIIIFLWYRFKKLIHR